MKSCGSRHPKIGVVYDDPLDDTAAASLYFNAVIGQVGAWFHACGLEGTAPVWPEGTHPCMPLSEWKRFFSATIRKPYGHDLFARRELFDLREFSGDPSLLTESDELIAQELEQTDMLVPLLANDTLRHLPPLTVFRGLVLDNDGAQRETLDLAEFVVNPISDAARVFVLGKPGAPINTLDRAGGGFASSPENAAVFKDAADAFRIALYHQTVAGTPSSRLRAREARSARDEDGLFLHPAAAGADRLDLRRTLMNAERYFAHFENSWTRRDAGLRGPLRGPGQRDHGSGPRRDRLITIGAVAVEDGEIRLDDSFEALLKLDYNRASVTVHGITRDEASEGMDEPEALELFLDYLRDGVIVGHHIGHDIQA